MILRIGFQAARSSFRPTQWLQQPSFLSSSPSRKNKTCSMSIGRMLDLGGMPSGSNDQSSLLRAVDASKNSKLQAVAFDFEILTRSLDYAAKQPTPTPKPQSDKPTDTHHKQAMDQATAQSDLDRIQQFASLLNVPVDIMGPPTTKTKEKEAVLKPPKKEMRKTQGTEDIRAKYASKLKRGLAGIELAKSQVEETLKGGDAAGHMAARQMAVKETAASPSKWMALTGTGKLLSYLTHRSIRIALLPSPKLKDEGQRTRENQYMDDFSKQMKSVVIDSVVPFDEAVSTDTMLKAGVLDKLGLHANRVLVVSDKDEHLRAAKDMGMLTCRLRPQNARRGNVTTHYNTTTVSEVQEVVNEINGISFNAVLNR